MKRALFYGIRAEAKTQSKTLFSLSWECVHTWLKFSASPCVFAKYCPSATLLILQLQIHFGEQVNLQKMRTDSVC